jgi:hypothetical protein
MKAFLGAAGAVSLALSTALGAATPASAGSSFPAAVGEILRSQSTGPVSQLPAAKKEALIVCVNQVLAALPNGKKRYVVEAATFDEREDRFGRIVMENHAEWKQRIARGCAHIVI